ncbi:hypothetical protein [Paenibacillus massiliensis]|uniref:hypothetical protein n=1 Tax=Paenibacillus massiliensis TaxID=225917 RepID=UPI00037568B2|nr:hypothetical protein [Paenibacillus massiliensis]
MLAKEYVEQLVKLTAQLVERIDYSTYEELSEFSEERERLVQHIAQCQATLTPSDKQHIVELQVHDEIILGRMSSLKSDAGEWLIKQEAIKGQKSAYNASYTPDSMFFDRKN